MAVDREKLADVQMGGYWYPGTGGFIALGMAGHSPGIGLPYDPGAVQHVDLYDHPDQRAHGRLLRWKLQFQHYDRLDPLVGTADVVPRAGPQSLLMPAVPPAFVR